MERTIPLFDCLHSLIILLFPQRQQSKSRKASLAHQVILVFLTLRRDPPPSQHYAKKKVEERREDTLKWWINASFENWNSPVLIWLLKLDSERAATSSAAPGEDVWAWSFKLLCYPVTQTASNQIKLDTWGRSWPQGPRSSLWDEVWILVFRRASKSNCGLCNSSNRSWGQISNNVGSGWMYCRSLSR